ncbi:hypothetical protein [Bradyrhizobium denitrificans]|uniref:hypothetical protein n=1 Tax=Bradyrhizobium denitrificans TaxID=2734912 RepID=UPI00155623B7|nr:hypothetical protein [Bradyrhizobium sp. LMG 8443]NPU23988.1 hypothetical protein [Bradyrhizobium sp. LMG 8443]
MRIHRDEMARRAAEAERVWLKENGLWARGTAIFKPKKRSPAAWARWRKKNARRFSRAGQTT